MKRTFLTPEAEWIFLDAQDIIRTSGGNGLDVEAEDNEKGYGVLVPLG